jgi:flagellar protein FlaG
MSFEVPRVAPPGPAEFSAVQQRPQVERPAAPPERRLQSVDTVEGVKLDTLPSRPPLEVLEEIAAADRRYEELRSQQRELHFKHDDASNRVIVEVRDMEGNVLRTVPPSKALEIIAGGPFK